MQAVPTNQMMHIRDVFSLAGSWTVKVMVQEKTFARTSQHTSLLSQDAYLVVVEGTVVKLVLEGPQVHRCVDTLKPFSYYYISDAKIRGSRGGDAAIGQDLYWAVTGRTKFVVCQEAPLKDFNTLSFVPFKHLKWHLDTDHHINVVALVIGIPRKRKISMNGKMTKVRQLLLIDRSALPVYLILNESEIPVQGVMIEKLKPTVNDPIALIATRVSVSSVAGFSLSLAPTVLLWSIHLLKMRSSYTYGDHGIIT